jgi:hypothetical protein
VGYPEDTPEKPSKEIKKTKIRGKCYNEGCEADYTYDHGQTCQFKKKLKSMELKKEPCEVMIMSMTSFSG